MKMHKKNESLLLFEIAWVVIQLLIGSLFNHVSICYKITNTRCIYGKKLQSGLVPLNLDQYSSHYWVYLFLLTIYRYSNLKMNHSFSHYVKPNSIQILCVTCFCLSTYPHIHHSVNLIYHIM